MRIISFIDHSEGNSKSLGSLQVRSLTLSDEPANGSCASQCPIYRKGDFRGPGIELKDASVQFY
jgi:hypothetical protein